jgi:prepilin-type N-terminal cleavage/methylation domain-containing protein
MRKNSGFTLMEVMMVIAIIGVLCAIATPNLVKWLPRHRVGSAARDVMSALDFARLNAIKANGAVTLTFDFTGDRLTGVDSGGTILRTLGMPADVDLDNEVEQVLGECYEASIAVLRKHRKVLDEIAAELQAKQELDGPTLRALT